MKKIALCGFYGHHNFGDTLMRQKLEEFLKDTFEVQSFSDASEGGCLHFKHFNPTEFDYIALGGGGILTKGFWYFKEGFYSPQLTDNLILLNVGITTEAEPVLTSIGNSVRLAVLRDQFSVELAAKYIDKDKIIYAPDISFLGRTESTTKTNAVTVYLNHYVFKDFFSTDFRKRVFAEKGLVELASFLDWVQEKYEYQIVMAPLQVSLDVNDNISIGVLNGFLKKKAAWDYANTHVEQLIQLSKFVVSSRYHSSVLALKHSKPFLDITHHSKNSNFLKDVGLQDYSLSYWQLELNTLKRKFEKLHDLKDFTEKSEQYGVLCTKGWKQVSEALKTI